MQEAPGGGMSLRADEATNNEGNQLHNDEMSSPLNLTCFTAKVEGRVVVENVREDQAWAERTTRWSGGQVESPSTEITR